MDKACLDSIASMIPFPVYWSGKGDCGNMYLPYKIVNSRGGGAKKGYGSKRPVSSYSHYWTAVNENLDMVKAVEEASLKHGTSYWGFINSPLSDTIFNRFSITLHNKFSSKNRHFVKPFVLFRKFNFDEDIPEVVMVKYQLTMNITEYKVRKDFTNATTVASLLDNWTGARRHRETPNLIDRKNQRQQGKGVDDDIIVFYIKIANTDRAKLNADPAVATLEIESYLKAAYVQLTINSKGDYTISYNGKTDCIINLDPHNINKQAGMERWALVNVVGRILSSLITKYNVASHLPRSATTKGVVDATALFDTDLLETFPLYTNVSRMGYKWTTNIIEGRLSTPVDIGHLAKRLRLYMTPTFRLLYQNRNCVAFTSSITPHSLAQRKKFTIDLYHNSNLNPMAAIHLASHAENGKGKANTDLLSILYTQDFIDFYHALYGEDPTTTANPNYRRAVASKSIVEIPGLVIVYPVKGGMFTKIEIYNEVSVHRVDFIKMSVLQLITAELPVRASEPEVPEMTGEDSVIREDLFNYNKPIRSLIVNPTDEKSKVVDNSEDNLQGEDEEEEEDDIDVYNDDENVNDSDNDDGMWDFDEEEDDDMETFNFNVDNGVKESYALGDLKALATPKIPLITNVLDFKDPKTKSRDQSYQLDNAYRQVHNVYPQRRIDPLLYATIDRKDKDLGLPYSQQYGNLCKASNGAIPIILSEDEYTTQKDKLVNSSGAPLKTLKVGTSRVVYDNYLYACPEIWCPLTRQAYSREYFMNQLGGKCPKFNGISQSAIDFRSGSKTNPREAPYFTTPPNPPHPLASNMIDDKTKFIYPCCGQNRAENGGKELNKKLFNLEVLESGETTQLPSSFIQEQFKTTATDIYIRYAGITRGFVEHALEIVGIQPTSKPNEQLAQLVEQHMTPFEFVMLNGGTSVKRWLASGIKSTESIEGNQWWRRNDRTKPYHIARTDRTTRDLILRSFLGFLAYLRDDSYLKTHVELHHLFSEKRWWLNKNGIRLVVFTFKFDHVKKKGNGDGGIFNSSYVSPFSTKPSKNSPIGVITTTDQLSYNRVITKVNRKSTFSSQSLPIVKMVDDENRKRIDDIAERIVLQHGCGWEDVNDYTNTPSPKKRVVISWDFAQVAWTRKDGTLLTHAKLEESLGEIDLDSIPIFVKNVDEISLIHTTDLGSVADYYDTILLQSNSEVKRELMDGAFIKHRQMYMLPPHIQKALRSLPVDVAGFIQLLTETVKTIPLDTKEPAERALLTVFALQSHHCPTSLKLRIEQLMEALPVVAHMDIPKFADGLAILKGLDKSLLKTFALELIGLGSMKDTRHTFFEAFYNDTDRDSTESHRYIWLTQQDVLNEKLKGVVDDLKHYRFENQTQMTMEDNRLV